MDEESPISLLADETMFDFSPTSPPPPLFGLFPPPQATRRKRKRSSGGRTPSSSRRTRRRAAVPSSPVPIQPPIEPTPVEPTSEPLVIPWRNPTDTFGCYRNYARQGRVLGKGAAGTVHEVVPVCWDGSSTALPDCSYAIKVEKIEDDSQYDMVVKEWSIQKYLNQYDPALVPTPIDAWICKHKTKDKYAVYLVMTRMDGNMQRYWRDRMTLPVSVVRQMCDQINLMSNVGAIHGDLKLDQLLWKADSTSSTQIDIRIGDFGYSSIRGGLWPADEDYPQGWLFHQCPGFRGAANVDKAKLASVSVRDINLWQFEKSIILMMVTHGISIDAPQSDAQTRFIWQGLNSLGPQYAIPLTSRRTLIESCLMTTNTVTLRTRMRAIPDIWTAHDNTALRS